MWEALNKTKQFIRDLWVPAGRQPRNTATGQWIVCLKGEETYYPEKLIAGLHDTLYLCIPPPYNDLSFKIGLWDYVNSHCETMFDQFEEELIDEKSCSLVAAAFRDFLRDNPIVANKETKRDFYVWMETLMSFLIQSSQEEQQVELRL